jgi:hypothetical protein
MAMRARSRAAVLGSLAVLLTGRFGLLVEHSVTRSSENVDNPGQVLPPGS